MKVGMLYEKAVELSPQAAHIAARLLSDDPLLPANLRRALTLALGRSEQAARVHFKESSERDAHAAICIVTACRELCMGLDKSPQ